MLHELHESLVLLHQLDRLLRAHSLEVLHQWCQLARVHVIELTDQRQQLVLLFLLSLHNRPLSRIHHFQLLWRLGLVHRALYQLIAQDCRFAHALLRLCLLESNQRLLLWLTHLESLCFQLLHNQRHTLSQKFAHFQVWMGTLSYQLKTYHHGHYHARCQLRSADFQQRVLVVSLRFASLTQVEVGTNRAFVAHPHKRICLTAVASYVGVLHLLLALDRLRELRGALDRLNGLRLGLDLL